LFFKKNQNRTETCSNRPVSVRFFRTKTGSNRFGSVFSGLAWFFSDFYFSFGSVRFGFLLIKSKPNRTGRFFQNFNQFDCFFFCSVFSIFSVFLITPPKNSYEFLSLFYCFFLSLERLSCIVPRGARFWCS